MSLSSELIHLERPGYSIDLFIPNAQEVKEHYFQQKQAAFPHWTKLWPSALAMSDFIYQHPELVQHKKVLELAAGLGLPSFIAARFANTVCCSDYLQAAVDTMTKTTQYLQLSNLNCRLLDWNQLPEDLVYPDILLVSDINYDPSQFEQLYEVLQRFLQHGTLILLATPQRLMAKPFIEKLLPDCKQQYEIVIDQQDPISLLLLQ